MVLFIGSFGYDRDPVGHDQMKLEWSFRILLAHIGTSNYWTCEKNIKNVTLICNKAHKSKSMPLYLYFFALFVKSFRPIIASVWNDMA